MASFVATRLLYAALFFILGAWVATVSPGFKELVNRASQTSVVGFEKVRDWTSTTLRGAPPVEAPTPAASKTDAKTATTKAADARTVAAKAADAKAANPKAADAKPAALQAAASTEAAPGGAAPASAPSAGELLIRARQAFAMGDIVASINAYRAYIDRNPASVDARGELGNVYFAEGRRRDAAEMYLEAAVLRLKAGDIAGAKALLDAVWQMDPVLGADLDRRIGKAEAEKK